MDEIEKKVYCDISLEVEVPEKFEIAIKEGLRKKKRILFNN